MSTSYTIDFTERDGSWKWRLYDRGGSRNLNEGYAETIETALDHAKTMLLMEHRTPGPV